MNIKYLNIGKTGKFVKISFEQKNILIGSLFTEAEILSIKNIFNFDSHMGSEKNCNEIFSENKIPQKNQNFIDFLDEIILSDFNEILTDTDLVIFTNLDEILSWPFMLRKKMHISNNLSCIPGNINNLNQLNYLKKIKFICTEPILQISRTLLPDFYNYFNKLMHENIEDYPYYVNSIFINEFLDNIITINYNCDFKIEDHLELILGSSGFSLGSSNILFKYYNKKIIYLSKSSNFKFRYPKSFEFFEIINPQSINKFNCEVVQPDVLIVAENIINYENDYIFQLEKIINNINMIMQHYDRENNHYPTIFIPTETLFMLDFVDIIRFKISNEIKSVYLSNIIKAVLEYSNVSHGCINKMIHDKIYEFKLPFNYDELIKNKTFSFFDDFEEFIKFISVNEANTYTFPKILMVNYYSLITLGISSDLFNFFKINSSGYDAFFNLIKNSLNLENLQKNLVKDINKKENFKLLEFNFDYRFGMDEFSEIILNKWKPKKIYFNSNIIEDKFIGKNVFLDWLNKNFSEKNINSDLNANNSIKNKISNEEENSNVDFDIEMEFEKEDKLLSEKFENNKNNCLVYESKIIFFNDENINNSNKIEKNTFIKFLKSQNFSKQKNYENLIKNQNSEKIEFEELFIEKAYILDKKENICDVLTKEIIKNNKSCNFKENIFNNKDIKLKFVKENENFYFSPIYNKDNNLIFENNKKNELEENLNSFNLENFEINLKEILNLNNMKVNEIRNKENIIEIIITKNNIFCDKNLNAINNENLINYYSEIKITKKKNLIVDLEISCENIDDSYFLNNILGNYL